MQIYISDNYCMTWSEQLSKSTCLKAGYWKLQFYADPRSVFFICLKGSRACACMSFCLAILLSLCMMCIFYRSGMFSWSPAQLDIFSPCFDTSVKSSGSLPGLLGVFELGNHQLSPELDDVITGAWAVLTVCFMLITLWIICMASTATIMWIAPTLLNSNSCCVSICFQVKMKKKLPLLALFCLTLALLPSPTGKAQTTVIWGLDFESWQCM